jgi:hypothetical protein
VWCVTIYQLSVWSDVAGDVKLVMHLKLTTVNAVQHPEYSYSAVSCLARYLGHHKKTFRSSYILRI